MVATQLHFGGSVFGLCRCFRDETGVLATEIPIGYFDAWARINVKASYLTQDLMAMEAIGQHVLHPDYPMLLPATVARFWVYSGAELNFWPQLVSWSISIGLLFMLALSIARNHNFLLVPIVIVLCLSNDTIWYWAAMQYADVLLSLLFLMSTYFLNELVRGNNNAIGMYLFSIGATAWCKNEGLVFALVSIAFAIAFAFIPNKKLRQEISLGGIVGGVIGALSLAATFAIKLFAASSTDLLQSQDSWANKIADASRYERILASLWEQSQHIYLPVFVTFLALTILVVFSENSLKSILSLRATDVLFRSVPTLNLLLMAGIYFLIYVITPNDLEWHIGTSMDRLILHLWAPGIFALISILPSDRLIESSDSG